MSRLRFKEHVYTYEELLKANIKGVNLYAKGEVIDELDGEICDISDIRQVFSIKYIGEILSKKESNTKNKGTAIVELKSKFDNKAITRSELGTLLKYINQDKIIPDYNRGKGYIIVNLSLIPKNITFSDYGRFSFLLEFLSSNHHNRLSHGNQHPLSRKDLANELKFKTIEALNKYLNKMKKLNLIREDVFGGIKYLIINPAYAKKNMSIDRTVYAMFKNDLDKCLTEYQIEFLNMADDSVNMGNLISITD